MKVLKKLVIIAFLLASMLLVAVNQNFVQATEPTLAVNTSATGYKYLGTSVQVTLTTTAPNTLLYLSIAERPGSTITGVSSNPTLTWTKRGAADSSWYTAHLETWYTTWSSSGTITITVSTSSVTTATVVAFAVTGADLTSPFDGAARIATSSTAGQMWPQASISISTSNANDMIIGSIGVTGYSDLPTLTPGAGFTNIQTSASTGNTIETASQYKVVSTTQTGLQIVYYYSSVGYGSMIADAIKAVTVQPTTVTVACTPQTVDKNGNMQTTIQGTLKAGTTGLDNKDIVLTYNNGQPIATVQTNNDGSGSYSYSWTVPNVANGFYAVKAQFTGDNQPYQSSAAETNSSPGGGGLFVVPEYLFGSLMALCACLAGFAAYKKNVKIPA